MPSAHESAVLPIHIAVHYLGCAAPVPDGIALGGNDGPFIACLADRVTEVTVVAYDPPRESDAREDLVDFVLAPARRNVSFLSLGPKGTWRDHLVRRRRVRRLIHKASKSWDVILFRLVNRRALLVFRANRCPRVIATLGGSAREFVRVSDTPLMKKFIPWLAAFNTERTARIIARSSGLFFVNGERLLSQYQAIAPRLRLLRSSSRRAHEVYFAKDRLNGEQATFLVVGDVHEGKGVFDAIEAFARIRTLIPNGGLGIVGAGSAMPRLEAAVRRLGLDPYVRFHGWLERQEVFRLLRSADVLLCLSHGHFESVPRVVHEAMAHSVLVVSTRTGAIPFVFEDRKDLMLVDEGDVDAVVECVEELIRDPDLRRRLLIKGFDRAREMTVENVLDQFVEELSLAWPEVETSGSYQAKGSDVVGEA